jgi:hypothetical protein
MGKEVVVGVALDVRFVHHVQAIAVAQFVPSFVVGVVGCAHRVEMVLLHQQDVLHHRGGGQRFGRAPVMFVAVDPFDQHPFPVDQQGAVGDPHRPDAGSYGVRFVVGGDGHRVQRRILVVPQAGMSDTKHRLSFPSPFRPVRSADTDAPVEQSLPLGSYR